MPKALNDSSRPLPAGDRPGGTTGFSSWQVLEDMFRRAGVVRPSESITHFVVEERGISFIVESN